MDYTNTILIVDDEPAGRETLEALLLSQGYNLILASNGFEALDKTVQFTPDLILLDVMMPGMDGYEVCQRLRADPSLGEVPIIMVTALDDRDSRLRASMRAQMILFQSHSTGPNYGHVCAVLSASTATGASSWNEQNSSELWNFHLMGF